MISSVRYSGGDTGSSFRIIRSRTAIREEGLSNFSTCNIGPILPHNFHCFKSAVFYVIMNTGDYTLSRTFRMQKFFLYLIFSLYPMRGIDYAIRNNQNKNITKRNVVHYLFFIVFASGDGFT